MNENEERAYIQGTRSAWTAMLHQCLKRLGYDNPDIQRTSWILEREDVISQLRDLCSEFGDNDWDEELHLADVIKKHLGKYLLENIT